MKNKTGLNGIFHDIRNPLSCLINNFSTLDRHLTNFRRLLLCGKNLIEQAEKTGGVGQNRLEESLHELKTLYGECDFDFVTDDLKSLVTESRESCELIREKLQDLQTQLEGTNF